MPHPYNTYILGTAVTVESTFAVSSTNTDPTGITLTITDPSGNADTYSSSDLTNSAVGVYSYSFTPNEAGLWQYRFVGTGAVIAANSFKFRVST